MLHEGTKITERMHMHGLKISFSWPIAFSFVLYVSFDSTAAWNPTGEYAKEVVIAKDEFLLLHKCRILGNYFRRHDRYLS